MTHLANLITFGFISVTLNIDQLQNTFAAKRMVTSSHAFGESQVQQ